MIYHRNINRFRLFNAHPREKLPAGNKKSYPRVRIAFYSEIPDQVGDDVYFTSLMSHLALSLLKSNFARVGVLSATE